MDEYLAALPDERRGVVEGVRDVVLANLPAGVEERMTYGMIGWVVPHDVYPPGYHADPRQPLPFASLASQARHVSLYLMALYCGPAPDGETDDARWFREAWAATGKRLDMGRSCVRFRTLDQVPLDVVGEAIRRLPIDVYVERYEQGLAASGRR